MADCEMKTQNGGDVVTLPIKDNQKQSYQKSSSKPRHFFVEMLVTIFLLSILVCMGFAQYRLQNQYEKTSMTLQSLQIEVNLMKVGLYLDDLIRTSRVDDAGYRAYLKLDVE